MYTRSIRKKRKDLKIQLGGLSDLIDNVMKEKWYIYDKELDYINDYSTDSELEIITYCTYFSDRASIAEIKNAILIVDQLIERMYASLN